MKRVSVGSHHKWMSDEVQAGSITNQDAQLHCRVLGFRIVHDGLFTRQIVRGSSRLNFDRDAGKPICDWNTGCNRFSSVGFRLVREEKES